MPKYILNGLPDGEVERVVEHQGSNLYLMQVNGKRHAYAEVHMNGSNEPFYVETRVPRWVTKNEKA